MHVTGSPGRPADRLPTCSYARLNRTPQHRRRERPKWLLDAQGRPSHLFNGVFPSKATHKVGQR